MAIDFRCIACALFLVALQSSLRAHGDDDHGAAKAAVAPTGGLRIASASSDRFEVVLKVPAGPLGRPVAARIFLSDVESNVPIAGAKVTVEIPDQNIKIIASPEKDAGIYSFELIARQAGHFDALVTLEPGGTGDPDLLPVTGLELGPAASDRTWHFSRWIVAGALLLIAVLAIAVFARIRRNRGALSREHEIFSAAEKESP